MFAGVTVYWVMRGTGAVTGQGVAKVNRRMARDVEATCGGGGRANYAAALNGELDRTARLLDRRDKVTAQLECICQELQTLQDRARQVLYLHGATERELEAQRKLNARLERRVLAPKPERT